MATRTRRKPDAPVGTAIADRDPHQSLQLGGIRPVRLQRPVVAVQENVLELPLERARHTRVAVGEVAPARDECLLVGGGLPLRGRIHRSRRGPRPMTTTDRHSLIASDPETRRALELDTLAAILPMDRRDRLAELLTDDDVATLTHLARAGMGAKAPST